MIDKPRLEAKCSTWNITLTGTQLDQLDAFAEILVDYNQKVNLTAITDPEGIEDKHFLDSLLFASQPEVAGRMVDVGAGAGFPGIVTKIYKPELELTLMEPTGKRVEFLKYACAQLGLTGVEFAKERAEEAARKAWREQFDLASARAVAALPMLAEYCLPLVKVANGEETARAIAMLPILLGQVGLPGTNPGDAEGNSSLPAVYLPIGKNPVKATIPVFMWTDAIVRGKDMTDITDGMRGVKKLDHDIKMIVNSGGNTMINQHSDSNATDKILRDTSKCEFIVVCDNMMTPTCRYADILLPDVLGPETDDIACQGGSNGGTTSMLPMHKAVEPQWDQKTSYEICRLIAKELGKEQEFTEGRTQLQWLEWCYNETRKKVPQLPDWDTFWKGGPAQVYGWRKNPVALSEFRADPVKNPLKTPSGKIEIYSERLNNIANTWKLKPGDVISPIPVYFRNWEMYGDDLQKKYPLQCYGFHHHGRIHSTFHNLPWLREQHPDVVFINVLDAKARGINNGDLVQIFNDRGIVELPAKVTSRIMPGVVSIPQGAWYTPVKKNGKIVDIGGNINTLTSLRPSPLAKGNPQHTNLVEVRKA